MFILHDEEEFFQQAVNGTIAQCEENRLRVKALGSIWNATLHIPCDTAKLIRGQTVRILGRKGIDLIIAP